jgi:hypothetical protein
MFKIHRRLDALRTVEIPKEVVLTLVVGSRASDRLGTYPLAVFTPEVTARRPGE